MIKINLQFFTLYIFQQNQVLSISIPIGKYKLCSMYQQYQIQKSIFKLVMTFFCKFFLENCKKCRDSAMTS